MRLYRSFRFTYVTLGVTSVVVYVRFYRSFRLTYVTLGVTSIVIYVRLYRASCAASITRGITTVVINVRAYRSFVTANVTICVAGIVIRMRLKSFYFLFMLTGCNVPVVGCIRPPFFRIRMFMQSNRQYDSAGCACNHNRRRSNRDGFVADYPCPHFPEKFFHIFFSFFLFSKIVSLSFYIISRAIARPLHPIGVKSGDLGVKKG